MAKRQATSSAAAPVAKKAKVPAKESSAEGKAPSAKKGATKANESVKQTKALTPPPEETNKPATRKRKTASDFIELDGESSKATTTKDVGTDKQPASKKKVKVSQPAEVGPSKKLAAKQETIKTAKAPAPSKSVLKPTVPKESVSVEQGREEEEEEDTFVHGFTSSSEGGADSSDEDDSDFEGDDAAIAAEKSGKGKKALDVAKLPTVAKDDKSVQRKLAKARRKQDSERGVLYLGRIPHGFYEDEMKAYFSQFGEVTRLRLARNRKTGASKHFAYIEMASKSVAEITAETMDNYLLLGHILKCSVVPQDKLHPDLWIGANKKWRRVPSARVARMTHDKAREAHEVAKANERLVKKENKRKDKIKSLGIDYDYDGFSKEAADVSMVL